MEKLKTFLKTSFVGAIAALISDFIILIILYLWKNYFQFGNPLTKTDFISIGLGSFLPLFASFSFLYWTGVRFSDGVGRALSRRPGS